MSIGLVDVPVRGAKRALRRRALYNLFGGMTGSSAIGSDVHETTVPGEPIAGDNSELSARDEIDIEYVPHLMIYLSSSDSMRSTDIGCFRTQLALPFGVQLHATFLSLAL